ncbi:DNA-directed RNA polymerase I subunit RPA34.5-domain-containing protein [Phialemonium atrogriseum]|uniref:DNA-directed RNA polymerase I subunit RPA34.5-domain-containing protein n=1 Tax=Phialemonium atrogriseum TaxID=1093897 RepID=A0AAJ0FMS5_9PEZI|nr:DNA-directed RNA polymerase I subunit RPA34.5-domain-containing protein [Phialemonium atrogriseum]KAK1766440.1 DNA-directed RNA polymerase I subunit RPA34.5-domain-containing protein [Phialemonium atrogriseum]
MAGPKAPIGSLSEHATQSARLARRDANPRSRPIKSSTKKHKKASLDDEESDSSSASSDHGSQAGDQDFLLQMIASRSSAPKSKAKQASSGAAVLPTTKAKAKSTAESVASDKKSAGAAVKKEPTSDDERVSDAESESGSSSDSSSDSESEVATTAGKSKKTKEGGGARLKTESESESESSGSESDGGQAKAKKTVKKSPSTTSSSSESGSSGSESEAEEPSNKKRGAKTKKEKTQRKVKTSESEDSTSEEESSTDESTAKKAEAEGAESSDSDSSASESQSSTSSSEDGSDEEADESMAIDMRNDGSGAPVAEIIANDFHLRKAQENVDASDVAQVFSQAQMQGKQVWYFTAPASIPIEVVEKLEIPLERAQKGLSILSHNGDDYGVAFEDASTTRSIKLLIPNKAGDKYGMLNRPLDQTVHLKRITQFSHGNESSTTFSQSHTTTSRPARPQPAGLKSRYHPIGVSNGSVGKNGDHTASENDEDVEMSQAPALPSSQQSARKPKGPVLVETPKPEKKKRKHTSDSAPPSSQPADVTGSSKKPKKARIDLIEPVSASKVGRVTPILPPRVPTMNGASVTNSGRKESVVPLPPNFQRMSQSMSDPRSSPTRSSPTKETPKAHKADRKVKGKDKDGGKPTPKVTPVTPPVPHVQRRP